MGPNKQDVLRILRGRKPERQLPLSLGQYEVQASIQKHDDGSWQLVAMRVNEARANEEGRRRLAAGQPWMPEMRGQFLEPAGVLLRADSAKALAELIETTSYPFLPSA